MRIKLVYIFGHFYDKKSWNGDLHKGTVKAIIALYGRHFNNASAVNVSTFDPTNK